MGEERLDLEEAGKLFGITANAMRARAKKDRAKYRLEADNAGKLWVWVDRSEAANERPLKAEMKPSLKGAMNPSKETHIRALQASIEVLKEELKASNAARDEWRLKAETRAEVAHRLEVSLAAITAKDEAGERERKQLRELIDRQSDENRALLAATLERMTAMAEKQAQEPRSWLARLLSSRAA